MLPWCAIEHVGAILKNYITLYNIEQNVTEIMKLISERLTLN